MFQVADTKEKIEKIAEDITERSENLDERKKEIEETNKVQYCLLHYPTLSYTQADNFINIVFLSSGFGTDSHNSYYTATVLCSMQLMR